MSGQLIRNLKIEPYSIDDNEQALLLEKQCIQGKSMALSFRRPYFHARSEVYKNYKIFSAKIENKMVGLFTAAEKFVTLNGNKIRTIYFYDCRIHPEFRHQGIAKYLNNALVEAFGTDVDCYYTLIAGQNKRALKLAIKGFRAGVVISMTYLIFPVYKKLKVTSQYEIAGSAEINKNFMNQNGKMEFVPEFDTKLLAGYVTGFKNEDSGCSIWTNENLLSEHVERIPFHFQIIRNLSSLFRPLVCLPIIPRKHETIKSWFLFDLYLKNRQSARQLLSQANNIALSKGKTFLYILMQNDDPNLLLLKKAGLRFFTLPYYFLAQGSIIPQETNKLFIDIRDI